MSPDQAKTAHRLLAATITSSSAKRGLRWKQSVCLCARCRGCSIWLSLANGTGQECSIWLVTRSIGIQPWHWQRAADVMSTRKSTPNVAKSSFVCSTVHEQLSACGEMARWLSMYFSVVLPRQATCKMTGSQCCGQVRCCRHANHGSDR